MKIIKCDWLKTQIAVFRDRSECLRVLGEGEEFISHGTNGMAGYSDAKTGLPLYFIYIDKKRQKSDPSLIGLIVHEASHLVDILLNARGIETSSVNTEVRGYMNEWLVNELVKIIKDRR